MLFVIIRVINLKIFINAFFFKLTIAKTLHIKFFSKFRLDSTQVSTISFTEDRKLYKIHFQRFQFQNNKKGERKREGKRREEAKPCTFLNRSAQPKTRYRRKSRIRFEKQVEFPRIWQARRVFVEASRQYESRAVFAR